MKKEDASKAYHKLKNRFFFIGLFLDIAVLLFLSASGLSFLFKDLSSSISSNTMILNGIYLLIFSALFYAVHFPLNFFVGFIWEHKFKLSKQTLKQWVFEDIKRSALSFVILLILIEAVYVLLGRFPGTWWIGAGVFWLFLTLVLARITPNVIVPIFYKYLPVDDKSLKDRIFNLFKKCNVSLKDVYSIDFSKKTKKANAMVCGLGKSRRVVLSDTLLKDFSPAEIETVVAHELGHYKNKDILKITVVNSIVVFLGFYIINKLIPAIGIPKIDDIAYFPKMALILMIFGFIMMPLLNWFSRLLEVKADEFSLQLTGDPEGFISMMNKLGEMNLAEFEPGRSIEILFYDHPPISKRIKFAKSYKLF